MVNNEQIKSEELQRDVDDLKRMQQEHISKSDANPLASPFDDLDEEHVAWLKKKNTKIIESIVERFQELHDHFIPLSTGGYDDPRKNRSGPAASTVVRDNQILFKKTLLKLCDQIRPNLLLTTGGTEIIPDDIISEWLIPDAAIQIEDTKVHERHGTKPIGLEEKSIRILSRCSLNQDISFGFGSKPLSKPQNQNHCQNQNQNHQNQKVWFWCMPNIDYLNPRPEYIRVIIIEWSIKSSIPIVLTVSLDTQRSLISARLCKSLDGYSQQVY
ncbi:unnamed protein product [Rotaria magnacalcarata]|uniref:Uncharacterized protein n=1 Tax=Rotaria magnacalcarata TaxID=392030 RepID=A0A8S2SKH5_9BILA|nr:unnamed protein product [Rotaria magnacalcarata]